MKVILLRDVVGVGQKGMVKEVSDGFAMNRLLPQKAAVLATPEKLKELKAEEKTLAENARAQEAEWSAKAAQLKSGKVTVRTEANDQGHLYQQLSMLAIAERIRKEIGVAVPPGDIHTAQPIKSIGHFSVEIKLGTKKVPVNVHVEKVR